MPDALTDCILVMVHFYLDSEVNSSSNSIAICMVLYLVFNLCVTQATVVMQVDYVSLADGVSSVVGLDSPN